MKTKKKKNINPYDYEYEDFTPGFWFGIVAVAILGGLAVVALGAAIAVVIKCIGGAL
jgi:hypothetical protein